jgi:lipopolysaccharide transport system permease protein
MLFHSGTIPLTALWLPVILLPFVALTLGVGWFLASLGVYLRDISQLLPSVMNALMFLSPVFFPSSAIPVGIRSWLFLNPVALPIEQTRNVLFWRQMPDFAALLPYTMISFMVAVLGYLWFQKTRKGFADVL